MRPWFLIFLWVAGGLWAQTPTPTSPPNAKPRGYEARTAWAKFRVHRIATSSGFEQWVSCDLPMTGWVLKRKGESKPLARGGLDASREFHFVSPAPFSEDLRLMVFIEQDGGSRPIQVAWTGVETGDENTVGEALDLEQEWRDDPSRPYNGVVQGLFKSAMQSYRDGRTNEALTTLAQAAKLDPRQPQVVSLRERILQETDDKQVKETLREARAQLKAGNPAIAMEKVDAVLARDPENTAALGLKKKIQKEMPAQPVVEKPKRVRKEKPVVSAEPVENPDAKGQADQAYNLGLESYRKGNWAAARSFWKQTLKLDSHHAQAKRALDRIQAEHPDLP